eukprot:4465043-Pyramimonas_sp.AAC.1
MSSNDLGAHFRQVACQQVFLRSTASAHIQTRPRCAHPNLAGQCEQANERHEETRAMNARRAAAAYG